MKIEFHDNMNYLPMYKYIFHFGDKEEIIYFWTFLDEEQTLYNKDFKYKPKLYKKTISKNSLRNYEIKDYFWLKTKIASYNWNERIYMEFNPIYILEIDSICKKAIITRVKGTEVEY